MDDIKDWDEKKITDYESKFFLPAMVVCIAGTGMTMILLWILFR